MTEELLDYDRSKAAAILLGTSRYDRGGDDVLTDIPAAIANIVDFERILRDDSYVGIDSAHVHRMLDERDTTSVLEHIETYVITLRSFSSFTTRGTPRSTGGPTAHAGKLDFCTAGSELHSLAPDQGSHPWLQCTKQDSHPRLLL